MIILWILVGLVGISAVWGFFSGGSSTAHTTSGMRTSDEAIRRNNVSLHAATSSSSLVSKLQDLSKQGYNLCFDDEVLLENPDLLSQLNENVRVSVSKDVLDSIEGYSKSSKYAFAVKQIMAIFTSRPDKKICQFDDLYAASTDLSPDKLSDRIVGAYYFDQKSNLHYNLLVTKRLELCHLAERIGLKALYVEY
ncbi:hypothetical protein [Paenibacillus sp. Y412MC10]|uniref:hypothetical protein n=1 Tax=Geobacillus sp. (strain Y412MC10) TaxID=481743 RepID=UPI0011AB6C21|nr:hypothetical protein [Paenibacillus sp. Y412MC10]